ncbi:uncharacterized protein TNCT_481971 [Trichonephila clavata]|uniref:Phospholipase A2-like domain-containing protein n=1 Tax=Trichonephila clavata TaxID=2740835 RepID=A0A8X6GNV1_TRICU|nr:uncharacterized protein TNCT_481971 [Trichonephila clavata]
MSNFIRNRFSIETNNYANFNPGTTNAQRFADYERILDADNYYPLSETELTLLNSEQSYGSTNFPELQEETSFIDSGNTVIDMSNVTEGISSESTPLLEGAKVGGKIGSTLTSVGTPGLLATGTLIGTGLGIGIKKVVDSVKKHGAVLPGSEYIGPGNPMPIGAAKDTADQIAKSHDDDYDKASKWRPKSNIPKFTDQEIHDHFEKLIQTADAKAIKPFYENFKNELDMRSLMAAGGLKTKQILENVFGVVYPKRKYFLFF